MTSPLFMLSLERSCDSTNRIEWVTSPRGEEDRRRIQYTQGARLQWRNTRTLPRLALKQDQQPARQRFGSFDESKQANGSPGDIGCFTASSSSCSHADATVLQFQCDRILDQTLSGEWQPGLFPKYADVHEHPEKLAGTRSCVSSCFDGTGGELEGEMAISCRGDSRDNWRRM